MSFNLRGDRCWDLPGLIRFSCSCLARRRSSSAYLKPDALIRELPGSCWPSSWACRSSICDRTCCGSGVRLQVIHFLRDSSAGCRSNRNGFIQGCRTVDGIGVFGGICGLCMTGSAHYKLYNQQMMQQVDQIPSRFSGRLILLIYPKYVVENWRIRHLGQSLGRNLQSLLKLGQSYITFLHSCTYLSICLALRLKFSLMPLISLMSGHSWLSAYRSQQQFPNVIKMNKFKLLSNSVQAVGHRKTETSHQQKQQRREQIMLLSILDKCTQILRDDRIWLRNRIKQFDPQILAVFRKSLRRPTTTNRISEPELHTLQVNLRKHVNRIKEKHKQEQLNRFKENMCSTNCMCEHKKHQAKWEGDRREYQHEQEEHRARDSEYGYRRSHEIHPEHSYQKQDDHQNSFNNLFKNKKKNLFEALKLNEPIQEQSQKQTQKVSSYRSKSQQPFTRINYHFEQKNSSKKQISNSPPQWASSKKPDVDTPPKLSTDEQQNWSMYNADGMGMGMGVHFDPSKNVTYEYSLEESGVGRMTGLQLKEGSSSGVKSAMKEDSRNSSQKKELVVNEMRQVREIRQGTTTNSLDTLAYQPLPTFQNQQPQLQSSSFQSTTYLYNPNPPITSSPFSSQKLLLDLPKFTPLPEYKPYDFSSATKAATSAFPKQTADDDNLFTSPELLMECRKILEKSAEKKGASSGVFEGYHQQQQQFSSPASSTATGIGFAGLGSYAAGGMGYTNSYSSNSQAVSHITTTTTTLVNNFTFKQPQSIISDSNFQPHLHDTKSIVDRSPYKMTTTINTPTIDLSGMESKATYYYERETNKRPSLLDNISAKDCFSEVKEIVPKPKIPEQKVNPLANLTDPEPNKLQGSFTRIVQQSPSNPSNHSHASHSASPNHPHPTLLIQNMSPQQVFDIFFFSGSQPRSSSNIPDNWISAITFSSLASDNFQQPGKFEKIFEFCDFDDKGKINALDFGRALDKLLGKQGPTDPIREVFGLIDIKQKGYFTNEDYQRFLEQVLESEQENYEEVATEAYRLFEMADVNQAKKVEYWGLYLTKETDEFHSFSEYLGQFEFEVEV